MAGLDRAIVKTSLLAHPACHSCVVCLTETRVATGGGDGEIAVHESTKGSELMTIAHRRVHKGAVTCVIRISEAAILSAGEDGAVYVSRHEEDNTLRSELVYRATLPVRRIALDREGQKVLMYGDERKLVLLDLPTRSLVASSDVLATPICAMAALSEGFLVADKSSKLAIVSSDTLAEGQSKTIAGSFLLANYCDIRIHGDEHYLLCCPTNGLFIGDVGSLGMIDHIRPPNARDFAMAYCGSRGHLMLLAHSHGVTPISDDAFELLADCPFPITEVAAIDGNVDVLIEEAWLFVMDKEGNLHLVTASLRHEKQPVDATPAKNRGPLAIFESSDEDNDEEKMSRKTVPSKSPAKDMRRKRSRLAMIDDKVSSGSQDDGGEEAEDEDEDEEHELSDYDVPDDDMEDGDGAPRSEDAEAHPVAEQHRSVPTGVHRPFQPSSTPLIHGYRIMCWNGIGIISSRQDAGYNSVELEFHDKAFHRPIRFIDEVGYTMAAVGRAGAVFASERSIGSGGPTTSRIYVSPVDAAERAAPWMLDLPADEGAVGVAIGGSSVAFPIIVATDGGFLRTFSMNGLQGVITNCPGKLVSMAANDRVLLVLYTNEWTGELGFSLYRLTGMEEIRSGSAGGRFQRIPLAWIGVSENDIAGVFDETGMMHILNPASGTWQPWLDCVERRERGERVWPISFNIQELLCIILKGSDRHPEAVPRPLQTAIPLRIPLVGVPDDSLVTGYERALRAKTALGSARLRPVELTDKEAKRLQVAADKHVLELIQLAIKADRPARVLELCALFQLEKSWEMAVQLVRHNRLVHLGDRIESLKDTLDQRSFPRNEDESTLSRIEEPATRPPRTPKLPKRIAAESPGTSLLNLTPGVRDHPIKGLTSPTPSSRTASLSSEASEKGTGPTVEGLPFARMSFEPAAASTDDGDQNAVPGNENQKGRSLVEMLKSVQQASAAASDKPRKHLAR